MLTARLAVSFPVEPPPSAAVRLDAEGRLKAAVAALEARGTVYTAAAPGAVDAATHVPTVTFLGGAARDPADDRGNARCKVAVPHAMATDHFVEYLWAKDRASGEVVAGVQLGPEELPELLFEVAAGSRIVAFAACNQHGVWQST